MAEEEPHEHEHKPRWELIEKLHDKIDDNIDKAYKEDKLSFMEVDFALLMIREKINQQKIELYNLYMKDEAESEEKKSPDTMYK